MNLLNIRLSGYRLTIKVTLHDYQVIKTYLTKDSAEKALEKLGYKISANTTYMLIYFKRVFHSYPAEICKVVSVSSEVTIR